MLSNIDVGLQGQSPVSIAGLVFLETDVSDNCFSISEVSRTEVIGRPERLYDRLS